MNFAKKLDRLMRLHGESQRSLAGALKVSHRAVGGWLQDSRPHRGSALLIAKHYGISVDVLLDDDLDLPQDRAIEALSGQFAGPQIMVPARIEVRPRPRRDGGAEYSGSQTAHDPLLSIINSLSEEDRRRVLDSLINAMVQSLTTYAGARAEFSDAVVSALRSATPTPEQLQRIKETSELLRKAIGPARTSQKALESQGHAAGVKIQTPKEVYDAVIGTEKGHENPPK